MKTRVVRAVLALAVVAMVAALPLSIRAAAQERVWGNLKGTIKSIDDKMLVIAPSMDKKAQSTFELTADAKRTGTLTVGAPVTVRFYLDNGKKVVTELTGKSSK